MVHLRRRVRKSKDLQQAVEEGLADAHQTIKDTIYGAATGEIAVDARQLQACREVARTQFPDWSTKTKHEISKGYDLESLPEKVTPVIPHLEVLRGTDSEESG